MSFAKRAFEGLFNTIKPVLATVPLSAWRRFTHRDLLAFVYHVVSDEPLPHVAALQQYRSTAEFEQDLAFLSGIGRWVTCEQVAAWLEDGATLPRNALHLSFDDGHEECFSVIRPILLRHGIPATYFITTDWIDNQAMFYLHRASLCVQRLRELDSVALDRFLVNLADRWEFQPANAAEAVQRLLTPSQQSERLVGSACDLLGIDETTFLHQHRPYLTTGQVKQLAAEGFTIGAHSLSHARLQDLASAAEMEREIVESCRTIHELTGSKRVPFAFPFDARSCDWRRLDDVRARHPFVGPIFGTAGIKPGGRLINRILAEEFGTIPAIPSATRTYSTLPRRLREIYAANALRWL